jgi:phosphatidylglycerol:prolipoprotein diacylglycerol transferase
MLIHPEFDPIAFHLGPIAVRWYGLMYLVGFVLFVVLGKHRARKNLLTGWHPRDVDDMLLYGVFGVILGGRLGYVLFYKPLYYLANPLEILSVWQGGMSFHGGFLGVLVALWFFARSRKKALARRHRFRGAARAARPCRRPSRQLHQRRAVGRATTLPWGMVFPPAGPEPRHPSQLYQFALEAAALRRAVDLHERRRPLGAAPASSSSAMACVAFAGVRARAGQLSRLPRASASRWAMAIAADDPRRRADAAPCLPACRQGRADAARPA